MSNNFLQWNPAAVNQQDDATYVLDVMRTGGAITGIFTSELANKLFYQCTTMVSALGESLSNKGYTISDASISTLITALSNILTKADFGTTAGTVCQGNDARFIPAGTKMWFYQNTAPMGWVIDSTPADAILAVKGGSAAYNVNGGMQAGTWSQPTHTHTGPLHSHTGPAHTHTGPYHTHSILSHTHSFTGGSHTHETSDWTLTVDQIPSHRHDVYIGGNEGKTMGYGGGSGHTNSYTSYTGGGMPHNHGKTGASTFSGSTGSSNVENAGYSGTGETGSSGTASTGNSGNGATSASSTANTWRPLAQVGIICTKS